MFGTKIYEPLNNIYKLCKQRKNPKIETQIHLLTDGAVQNSKQITELIHLRCQDPDLKASLHTIGVGEDVQDDFIKGCAIKGLGTFSFVE